MKILVMNCGSSSLKYQLMDMNGEEVLAKGICERIGIEGSVLTHKPTGKDKVKRLEEMKDHKRAVELVLDALVDPVCGVIKDVSEITAIGHRVLHGGKELTKSCLVDQHVKDVIRECFDLGPLHNPANLIGIEACEAAMPGKPNVAVFDTSFGMGMEPKAYRYALPDKWYDEYGVRRYGFHGTSHNFVCHETIKYLNLDPETARVIVCHLGNGASVSASRGGACVDTSMGLTPLEGLIMGTRSGDLDPAIVQFITRAVHHEPRALHGGRDPEHPEQEERHACTFRRSVIRLPGHRRRHREWQRTGSSCHGDLLLPSCEIRRFLYHRPGRRRRGRLYRRRGRTPRRREKKDVRLSQGIWRPL